MLVLHFSFLLDYEVFYDLSTLLFYVINRVLKAFILFPSYLSAELSWFLFLTLQSVNFPLLAILLG